MRLLPALLALLALAAPASAATVQMRDEVEREGGRTYTYGAILVAAAPGEANALEIAYDPQTQTVSITDAGAPLTGDQRCANVDANTVRCDASTLEDIAEVTADLGDGDDRATAVDPDRLGYLVLRGGTGDDSLTGRWATLHGGDGNDVLRGDAGVETMHGDAGNDLLEGLGEGDYLHGGAGDDTIRGGDGHDALLGGTTVNSAEPAGADALDGGAGHDTLDDQDGIGRPDAGPDALDGGSGDDSVYSYILRRAPVTIDLSGTQTSGERGEGDRLTAIENAYGGSGNDTLIGDDGPNRLDGDRGRDEIRGGGGDDVLISDVNPREDDKAAAAPRYGPDRVSGGAGDDTVETLAALRSEVSCGSDRDRVRLAASGSTRGPLLSRNCERLTMSRLTVDPFPVRVTERSLVFEVLSKAGPRRLALRPTRVHGGRELRVAHDRFAWRVRVMSRP